MASTARAPLQRLQRGNGRADHLQHPVLQERQRPIAIGGLPLHLGLQGTKLVERQARIGPHTPMLDDERTENKTGNLI